MGVETLVRKKLALVCPECGLPADGAGPSGFICKRNHTWGRDEQTQRQRSGDVAKQDTHKASDGLWESREAVKARLAQRGDGEQAKQAEPAKALRVVSARALLTTDWPEPAWLVPGLLPVGLTLLAGRPKVGKSWLALQLMQAVATGGMFFDKRLDGAPCLYLALEDSPRRLANRMKGQAWQRLDVVADFVSLGEARDVLPLNGRTGGAVALADAIRECGYRFVVIDTLSRALVGDQNTADVMTAALAPLQEAAHEYNAAVLLLDHHNKLSAASGYAGADGEAVFDPVLNVLGSTAKAALADCLWGLYKQQGKVGATLAVVGRDVEERQLSLKWDRPTKCWQCEGDADQLRLTGSRQAILTTLRQLGPAQLATIAKALGQDKGNTHRRLQDLVDAGLVLLRQMTGIPFYSLPEHGEVPTTGTTTYNGTTPTTPTTAL